ncbi:PREDICTED: phospholipase A1-like [Rhagoletis zephyria]|uniref:phospholipase A1-like n=1 Tax=Rhagoletis zephyria TaxID=28612 RepID=UPI00081136D2|nr:PREDICTED: phospholipase A1-like [Rhagoletis zephyria]
MKAVTVLLLAVATAVAIPIDEDRQSGEDGWYVPQLDGSFEWMTVAESEDLAKTLTGRTSTVSVYFYLYTNENPSSPDTLVTGNVQSLKASHFDNSYPTKFIIHGWQNSYESALNPQIRDAFLSNGKYNIISVDWSDKATSNYVTSKSKVSEVGKQVAAMIDFLYKEGGLSFDTLHVIGHSLGAHISGFAGKNVKNGRIQQITGLDPASPLFSYDKPTERLYENDAEYVESIHTCGAILGFLEPIGKAAFYPNGGKSQPGCGLDITGACSHGRSWMYYAEAISENDFPSVKCESYEKAVKNSCGSTYSSIRMAAPSNIVSASGNFYVPVNKKSPYGMGQ